MNEIKQLHGVEPDDLQHIEGGCFHLVPYIARGVAGLVEWLGQASTGG